MIDNTRLEELTWGELEQAVTHFIAGDGANTDDLPIDDFFSLWAQVAEDQPQRVVEVEGEIVEHEVMLSLVSSNIGSIKIQGHEILLPDGTRIVLNLRAVQPEIA